MPSPPKSFFDADQGWTLGWGQINVCSPFATLDYDAMVVLAANSSRTPFPLFICSFLLEYMSILIRRCVNIQLTLEWVAISFSSGSS